MANDTNDELRCSRRGSPPVLVRVHKSLKKLIVTIIRTLVSNESQLSELPVHDIRAMRDIGLARNAQDVPQFLIKSEMRSKNLFEVGPY